MASYVFIIVAWIPLVITVWCAHVAHLLFYSLSRTHQVATLVRCIDVSSKLFFCFSYASLGRQFYKCTKRDGGCDFFLWADSPPTAAAPVNSTRTAPPSRFGGDDYRLVEYLLCPPTFIYVQIPLGLL